MTRLPSAIPIWSISASGSPPFVSVLLAVRNEARLLPDALAALAKQDYSPARRELIIADGDSSDGTLAIVRAFARRAPYDVRIVDNPKRSAAAGFNAALRHARGSVIVVLGARALPAEDFLTRSVNALRESGADAVGGVVNAFADSLQGEAAALALASRFGVGGARYRYGGEPGDVDTVNYGAYRRDVFAVVGGFDETMDNVEDDEFNYRLRAAGRRLYLSPDIRCRYVLRPGLASLARQFGRYGFPKVRVLRRYPRQMQPRQFAPAALVAALLIGLAGYGLSAPARRLFWLAFGAYALASGLVSALIARRHGWRYLPLLPAAFAAIHFAYGAASLAGLIRYLLWPVLLGQSEPAHVPPMDEQWSGAAEASP